MSYLMIDGSTEGENEVGRISSSGMHSIVTTSLLHGNLLLTRHSNDVYSILSSKYKVAEEEIGEGSIIHVSKVVLLLSHHHRRRDVEVSGNPNEDTCGNNPGYFRQLFWAKQQQQPQQQHYYALKQMKVGAQTEVFTEEIENEVSILRNLDHPNIVKIYEFYQNDCDDDEDNKHRSMDVICELCDGGDLYSRFPYPTEYDAADVIRQIVSAIKYMHDGRVVHRDIKFENIMFESKSPDAAVKLIDFGLSTILRSGKDEFVRTTQCVGTIDTMAPEVLKGVHSAKADMWAIGVVSFMLLSSKQPFFHYKRPIMEESIKKADYSFDTPAWKDVSDHSKDFVSRLLVVDPHHRMSADDAIQHPLVALVRARTFVPGSGSSSPRSSSILP